MLPLPFPNYPKPPCPKLSIGTYVLQLIDASRHTGNIEFPMEPFISADQPITARSLPSEFSDSGAPLPQNTNTKHSHLHGLHHSDKHHRPRHHRHHSHRHVRDAVQAATVSDLLKPASRSSPHSSTRHVPDSSHSSVAKSEANGESNIPPPKPVKPEDVASERLNMKIREKYASLHYLYEAWQTR